MSNPVRYPLYNNMPAPLQVGDKAHGASDAATIRNPFAFGGGTFNSFSDFMNETGGFNMQNRATQHFDGWNKSVRDFGQYSAPILDFARGNHTTQRRVQDVAENQMRQQMLGKMSFAEQAGFAERDNAMRDIGTQASMQQGAQFNPAIARMAMMQQSGVGQNMAAQIAAQRAQERMAAQQSYIGAQDWLMNSQMGGQKMQLGMESDRVGMMSDLYQGGRERWLDQAQTWQNLMDTGLQAHAQGTTAMNQNQQIADNVAKDSMHQRTDMGRPVINWGNWNQGNR